MSSNKVGIAVDGGGSKTKVVCHELTGDGKIIGEAKTGSTNPHSVGDASAEASLHDGILAALASAGRSTTDVACVCLGMSGVDRPEDKVKVRSWVRKIFGPELPVMVSNDAQIALSNGTHGKLDGVVLICGTGTIALGYNGATGEHFRAAGWGALLCDPGSGYDIGQRVLIAVASAHDGRGPQTGLTEALLARLGFAKVEDIIGWIYNEGKFCWQMVADVAPLALDFAEKGDAVAVGIMNEAAAGLAKSIFAVAERLGYEKETEFTLVYAGGIACSGRISNRLDPIILERFPKAKIVIPKTDPVMGAVYLNNTLRPWETHSPEYY